MRIAASGGLIHSSSASATGRDAGTFEDVPRETGKRFYLLLIGIFVGCFFLSYAMQPWNQRASVQSQSRQMNAALPPGEQSANMQHVYWQSDQRGTAYGGAQYVAQPPSYEYGNIGQHDMRTRTNVNR